jgi:hypothetical protein
VGLKEGVVSHERYLRGWTWEEFLQHAKYNVDEHRQIYDEIAISEQDRADFAKLVEQHGGAVYVLVLSESWCGDSLQNTPLMAKLCAEVPGMHFRYFQSEVWENFDMTQNWPKPPRNPIPIMVFFDRDFREIGFWIERSKAADELRERLREQYKDLARPEQMRYIRPAMAEAYRSGELRRATLDEWKQVLSGRPLEHYPPLEPVASEPVIR